MKEIMLIMAGFLMSLAVFAQKTDKTKVPDVVISAFEKQYPGIKAKWEKEGAGYEVSFKKDGSDMSVIITEGGTIVETESDIDVTALPAGVRSYIKAHYRAEKILEAAKIIDQNGTLTYEAEIKGKDLLFDARGKFLNEVNYGKENNEGKGDNDRK